MKKLLKRLLRKEEGQSMAEYSVLFPGAILLVIAAAWNLGSGLANRYCEITNVFSNGICAVAAAGEGAENPVDESTPTPTPEACVVLQQEQGCSQCDAASPDCICLPGVNEGTYEADDLKALVIKAGKEYHVFYSGWTDDGCYYVQLEDTYAWWQKYDDGRDCQDVSHIQAWWLMICE
jgi:Flp pilus assembly pilin Flp